MVDDGTPIAYTALEQGVPVVARSGHQFGTVERVIEDLGEDIFHGIVVTTAAGLRFVDRDHVERMTTRRVSCALGDEEVARLPRATAEQLGKEGRQRPGRPWFRRVSAPWTYSGAVVIARCQRDALFETVWIPMVSVKAIRLGPYRIQRCPVHRRVEIVQPVDPATLTAHERAEAARHPAVPIP